MASPVRFAATLPCGPANGKGRFNRPESDLKDAPF
jgi:hypothetical protein